MRSGDAETGRERCVPARPRIRERVLRGGRRGRAVARRHRHRTRARSASAAGIRALGRAPQELRGVVVTHLHGDHVGGLAAVKAHTGAEVWMQAEDAAAVREGVRGRALEPGPGVVRSVIVRVVGGRAAASTGDPHRRRARGGGRRAAAVRRDGRCTRRGTPPATWRCCCRGTAACSSPATPPPTCCASASARSTRTSTRGMRSLRRLADLQFETALFSHGRPLAPRAAERFRARFSRAAPTAQFAQESLVDARSPRRMVRQRARDGRLRRRGGTRMGTRDTRHRRRRASRPAVLGAPACRSPRRLRRLGRLRLLHVARAAGHAHDPQGHGVQHRVRRHAGELRQGRRGGEEGAARRHRPRGGGDEHRHGSRRPPATRTGATRPRSSPASRSWSRRTPRATTSSCRSGPGTASRSPTCTCRPTTRARRRSAAAHPSRRSSRPRTKVRLPYIQTELEVLPPLAKQGIPTFLVGDFNAPSWRDYTADVVGTRDYVKYVVDWPVSKAVEAAGFTDSWRAVYPDPLKSLGLTWWAARPKVDGLEPGPERAAGPDRLHLLGGTGEGDGRPARRRAGRPGSDLRRRPVAVRPPRRHDDVRGDAGAAAGAWSRSRRRWPRWASRSRPTTRPRPAAATARRRRARRRDAGGRAREPGRWPPARRRAARSSSPTQALGPGDYDVAARWARATTVPGPRAALGRRRPGRSRSSRRTARPTAPASRSSSPGRTRRPTAGTGSACTRRAPPTRTSTTTSSGSTRAAPARARAPAPSPAR